METSARRRAENEGRFRAANEQIEQKAVELMIDSSVPFLCECADERCREILLLSLADFRAVRTRPMQFVTSPGHEVASEEVVTKQESFQVVEKQEEEEREVLGGDEDRGSGD